MKTIQDFTPGSKVRIVNEKTHGGSTGWVVEAYGETVKVELAGRGGDDRKFDLDQVVRMYSMFNAKGELVWVTVPED